MIKFNKFDLIVEGYCKKLSLLGGCSSDDGGCGNDNDRDGDNESSYTDCCSNDNDKNGGDEG